MFRTFGLVADPKDWRVGLCIGLYRSPEHASRSQRGWQRVNHDFLAISTANFQFCPVGFASLPKKVENAADIFHTSSVVRLSPSMDALLANVKLPPSLQKQQMIMMSRLWKSSYGP